TDLQIPPANPWTRGFPMCPAAVRVCSLGILLGLAAQAPAQKPCEDLPGSFQMFHVTGKNKGRFRCLVTDHGLNPAALVFTRDSKVDAKTADVVKSLLGMLNNAVAKNPNTRLGGFVVFVPDDLTDVARQDDKREQIETTLGDLHKDYKVDRLTFVLS